jgi:hypothetical protein
MVPRIRRRAEDAQRVYVIAFARNGARNASVDDIDGATDRLASEQQHRRPAQHLDAFGGQWIDGDAMVGRCIRHVERSDAVRQHADALALKATQHRTRGAG